MNPDHVDIQGKSMEVGHDAIDSASALLLCPARTPREEMGVPFVLQTIDRRNFAWDLRCFGVPVRAIIRGTHKNPIVLPAAVRDIAHIHVHFIQTKLVTMSFTDGGAHNGLTRPSQHEK